MGLRGWPPGQGGLPTTEDALSLTRHPSALSAGIGRTGCFIATSICCQQLRHEGVVDILKTTCQLRQDRSAQVQGWGPTGNQGQSGETDARMRSGARGHTANGLLVGRERRGQLDPDSWRLDGEGTGTGTPLVSRRAGGRGRGACHPCPAICVWGEGQEGTEGVAGRDQTFHSTQRQDPLRMIGSHGFGGALPQPIRPQPHAPMCLCPQGRHDPDM